MYCPTVKYNNYTFPNVMGPYQFSKTATDFTFSCRFLITASSSSGVISGEESMLTATKEIKKDFTVSFGGSEFSFSHSSVGGTGFNSRAAVEKIPDPRLSTECCRVFNLSVSVQLPYTQDNGRIIAKMVIDYTPARQVLATFDAVYSASTVLNALSVAQADTWSTSTLTTMFAGRTFELVDERANQDHNLKRVFVVKVYKEIVISPVSVENSTKVVDGEIDFNSTFVPQVGVMSTTDQQGGQICTVDMTYKGYVSKDIVIDQKTILDIWQKDIRARLLGMITEYLKINTYGFEDSLYIVNQEKVDLNPSTNVLRAYLSVSCKTKKNYLLEISEQITKIVDTGLNYIKLWDGQPNTFHMWSLGETTMLTRKVTKTGIDFVPTLEALPAGYNLEDKTSAWILLKRIEANSRRRVGTDYKNTGAKQYFVYEKTWLEYYLCTNKAGETTVIVGEKQNGEQNSGGS